MTDLSIISKLISKKAVEENKLSHGKSKSVLITRIQLELDKIVWCQSENIVIGDSIWNLTSDNELKNSTLFFSLRHWISKNRKSYSHGSIIQMLRSTEIMNMKINWVSSPEKQNFFLLS